MLSILIPTYHYNTLPLVEILQKQAKLLGIIYEIIVSDDATNDDKIQQQNQHISSLENCQYYSQETNLGRGENRNSLCQKAQYDWLLFLDCDTIPVQENFLKRYLDCIEKHQFQAVFGGIAYEKNPPEKHAMLRWVYGSQREAVPVSKRKRKPYESSLVSNILLRKDLLVSHPFHPEIYDYGFEDFVFIADLKKNAIEIEQIDNAVYHLNLESSAVFLEKHLRALSNLNLLITQNIIAAEATKIGKTRKLLQQLGLNGLTVKLFRRIEPSLRANLLSDAPSLQQFYFYKLGYFCTLKPL